MKRILFVLLMLIAARMSGQSEFAPVGAEWHYERQIMNYETWIYESVSYDRFRSLDTITINGFLCKKIELFQNTDCKGKVNPYYETRYINQDGEQIYEVIDGERYLLYDFSKQPGEYWLIKHQGLFQDKGYDTAYVREITEITLDDGSVRRKFHTSVDGTSSSLLYCTDIIEGIGMENSLFPYYALEGPPPCKPGMIRCYSEDGEYLIESEVDCDYEKTLSIEEKHNQLFTYNSIVKENLNIRLNYKIIVNVSIYDSMGRLIHNKDYSNDFISIDMSDVTSGVCFVKIFSKDKNYNLKILKL